MRDAVAALIFLLETLISPSYFLKDGQDHDWFLQDFVASAVISSLGSHCETSQGARPAKTVITLLTCCDTVFEH